MTIQQKAPTISEDAGTLLLRGRDAVKPNSNGGGVTLQGGNNTGAGTTGEAALKSQNGSTFVTVSNESGINLQGEFSTSLSIGNGFISVVGPQAQPPVDAPITFVAGLNSTSTGNNPFQFLTDSGIIFEFGEPTFGTPKMAFFGATPVVKPNITGSRSGNAALASFLSGLNSLGLVTDNTTAGTAPSGSGQTAATIGPIPYNTQYAEVTVTDANISATSRINISWGNVTDADENTPDMSQVHFQAIPSAGSMRVRLACSDPLDRLGGLYKINYLIG
jgi:hypothetical protein